MQPQFTPNVRQRPLQKSMFLPQTQQYVQRNNNNVDYQYQDMMKRSAIIQSETTSKPLNFQDNSNKPNSFIENQKQQQQQNFQFPNYTQSPLNNNQYTNNNNGQILNFSNGIRYKENARMGQFQHQPIVQSLVNQPSSISQSNLLPVLHSQAPINLAQISGETVLQQLQQKVNQLTQIVESHDEMIKKYQSLSPQSQNSQQKDQPTILVQFSQQLQARLKQSIIPMIISKQTKQIYEHIFDFKLEIKTIRQQINSINDSFKSEIGNVLNVNNNKSNSTMNSLEKIEKVDQSLSLSLGDINLNISAIENKLVDVQKLLNTKNEDLKTFLFTEIEKIKKQIKSHDTPLKIKSSTIKSTLSPIMIEYREMFAIKNTTEKSIVTRMGITSSPKREQKQITINSSTYFIDRQGYLLDSLNRYIIDLKGQQIKLDEKHLILLKQHNVLT